MENEQESKDKPTEAEETPGNTQVKKEVKKPQAKKKPRTRRKQVTKKPAKSNPVSNFQKPRPFPKVTLEEALQVPLKIKELNGGNPRNAEDLAKALDIGAKSNNLYYITAAARDFGLTIGTSKKEKIELADLGRDIVYAPNPQVEHEKKIEAFLKIEVFKKVLDYYKGSALPEMKYLMRISS